MLCAQLEVISYTAILHPLRRKILKALEYMLLSSPRGCWFTIYLTLFIILHSCSLITRRDEEFSKQIGRQVSQMGGVKESVALTGHSCDSRIPTVLWIIIWEC